MFARTNERTNARYLNKSKKPIYLKNGNKKTDKNQRVFFLKNKNGARIEATSGGGSAAAPVGLAVAAASGSGGGAAVA